MSKLVASEGPFKLGLNSVDSPGELSAGQYQWAVNCINKGGLIATRPGLVATQLVSNTPNPQGMTLFTPKDGETCLVIAAGGAVTYSKYPYTDFHDYQLQDSATGNALIFNRDAVVNFETAVIGVTEAADGTVTAIEPYPVLIMCDGINKAALWDGVTCRTLDPDPSKGHETPICSWMKWVGNRLWTMQGKKVRASNLLNPIKFTEENILAEGGFFNLPDNGTGFAVTPDFRSLLAFTEYTTTSFQAGILNRASWSSTPDFQKVLFYTVGCAAGRSIVNQFGMVWWYSHNGLMNLDSALQTYRSSEIRYKDAAMRRSRSNFADDISGICAAAYENYLLISVPSGDLGNAHTWVIDGNPLDASFQLAFSAPSQQWSSIWTGIRPVQWATGIVKGKQRCFCLSNNLPNTAATLPYLTLPNASIWEAFSRDKRDIGYDNTPTQAVKDIPCAIETRLIPTEVLCSIRYIELDLEEIVGTVQIDIYYATRRGTYKKFGSKQIVGTVGSVSAGMTVPTTFAQYLPQKRTVKSLNECTLPTDVNPGVETPYTKNVDKHFSFLIKWTGQMSLSKIRVYADPELEQFDGAVEANEATQRYIRPDGSGAILIAAPTALPVVARQSSFVPTITPRWSETIYQSNT